MEAQKITFLVFSGLIILLYIIYAIVVVKTQIMLERKLKQFNKHISEHIRYFLEGPLEKYEKPYNPEWIEKYRRELYRWKR